MRRWLGLLGSWALLILALSVCGVAAAAEIMNMRESRRFARFEEIDRLLAEQHREEIETLKREINERATTVKTLETKVASADTALQDLRDTDQTILVSTAENKVYVKRGEQTVFEAVCSTGSGKTLIENGKTMVFQTPIGKFRILSKEENPVWVPPDWHYIEEARKRGKSVVRLDYGDSYGGLYVRGKDVVTSSGYALPPGEVIDWGGAIVIPPVGTRQRQFDKVLGSYRLNLGDGYALHGTQRTDELGQSVSHGCVRLGDKDIAYLYKIANVGDEVIIY